MDTSWDRIGIHQQRYVIFELILIYIVWYTFYTFKQNANNTKEVRLYVEASLGASWLQLNQLEVSFFVFAHVVYEILIWETVKILLIP